MKNRIGYVEPKKFEALLKKLVIYLWFKVLSIAGYYFLPSFG